MELLIVKQFIIIIPILPGGLLDMTLVYSPLIWLGITGITN